MSRLNGTTKGALITIGVVAFSGLFGWVWRNTDALSDVKVESAIVSQQAKGIKEDISEIRADIRRILDKLNEE